MLLLNEYDVPPSNVRVRSGSYASKHIIENTQTAALKTKKTAVFPVYYCSSAVFAFIGFLWVSATAISCGPHTKCLNKTRTWVKSLEPGKVPKERK